MIFGLFRKSADSEAVYAVYSAIVAQSRRPVFYAEWGVPDTVTGRFDMISLHMSLLFRRLRSERKDVAAFSQAVFDLFFRDMDRSLREMGVTDIGIPKKIKKMGNIFYGLLAHISEAMDKGDRAGLEAVLIRNIYEGASAPAAGLLAEYLFGEADRLAAQPLESILGGRLTMGAEAA
ncbi:MAG TPA: ubiquinol-cytochrome C chaperone family protein [Devosia sp.]|nr:ubiquinol-cytochrome C chaperone family protein [Devosia sp.]